MQSPGRVRPGEGTGTRTIVIEGGKGWFQMDGFFQNLDATEEDMYAAIDALVDKLDRQGKKYKEK